MTIRKILFGGLLFLAAIGLGGVRSGEGAPPEITLSLSLENSRVPDRAVYLKTDTIRAVLKFENVGDADVITSEGFNATEFYLFLNFVGPDGKVKTANALETTVHSKTHVPPPKTFQTPNGSGGYHYRQGEFVEILPGTVGGQSPWAITTTVPDIGVYYLYFDTTQQAGYYTVKAVIPMRTYPDVRVDPATGLYYAELADADWEGALVASSHFAVIEDADSDGYFYPEPSGEASPYTLAVDCNDEEINIHPWFVLVGEQYVRDTTHEISCNGIDDDCDPSTPDQPPGTVCYNSGPAGIVSVRAEKHNIGTGNFPPSTKEPLGNLPFWVLDKSPGSCVANIGVNWQKYLKIFQDCIFGNSVPMGITDESGIGSVIVPPGSYLVLGMVDPDGLAGNQDEIFLGSPADVTVNETTQKRLQLIQKADGKKVAAKYTVLTGSQLLISEPEYVEWSGTQEFYPFVFEAVGDWGVTTSITPPEGFVTDHPSLTAEVINDLKSVQFLVTDVGSKWEDTTVVYTVKHKGREKEVKSRVGVRKIKDKDKDKDK